MSDSKSSTEDVITRTRFLIVDADRSNLEKIERYLLMAAAPNVYLAKSPLLALRILQEPRTPVDLVICAHRKGRISGIEFLQNLRVGRWGGKSQRHIPFILFMSRKDDAAIKIANSFHVNDYIFGELNRTSVTESVLKVLGESKAQKSLSRCRVAHIRERGVDLIIVPFDKGFGDKPRDEQLKAREAVQTAATQSNLSGTIVPVWNKGDGRMGFIAAENYHSILSNMTLEFVRANLNRELDVFTGLRD